MRVIEMAPPAPSTRSAAAPGTPHPAPGTQQPAPRTGHGAPASVVDVKTLLVSAIREQNKTFYGMVIAQAQRIEVEGDTVAFTFAPVHKSLRTQLDTKRAWIEQLGQSISGRKTTVITREGQPSAGAPGPGEAAAAARQAELRARALACVSPSSAPRSRLERAQRSWSSPRSMPVTRQPSERAHRVP